MSENKIQKGLAFLNSKSGNTHTAAGMPMDRKVQFLKQKLKPEQVQQVLKRFQQNDFQKSFQNQPSQPVTENSPSNYSKYFGWLSAFLIGSVGSALLFVRSNQNQSSRPPNPTPPRSQRGPTQRVSKIQQLLQAQKTQNQLLQRIMNQLANLQFSVERMKSNQAFEQSKENHLIRSVSLPNLTKDPLQVFNEFIQNFDSEDSKIAALKQLKLFIGNILQNPNDQTKRRINITNSRFKAAFDSNSLTKDLFQSIGFRYNGNFLELENTGNQQLVLFHHTVQQLLTKISPPITFSKSQPWKAQIQANGFPIIKKELPKEEKNQISSRFKVEQAQGVQVIKREKVIFDQSQGQGVKSQMVDKYQVLQQPGVGDQKIASIEQKKEASEGGNIQNESFREEQRLESSQGSVGQPFKSENRPLQLVTEVREQQI